MTAIVPFAGPQGKVAQIVVEKIAHKGSASVPAGVWARAVHRLNADNHHAEEIAQVAGEVGARLVITGSVRHENNKWLLLVLLRDGHSGEIRDRLRYVLPGPVVPNAVQDQLARDFADTFGRTIDELAAQAEAPTPGVPTVAVPPAPPPPPDDRPQRLIVAERNSPVIPSDSDSETSANYFSMLRPSWAPFFEVSFGGSISKRNLRVNPATEVGFSSRAVGGFRFDVTLYPLAPLHRIAQGVLSGIGIGLSLEKPVWPKSNADDVFAGLRIPTHETRVEGGLRWRFTLYAKRPWPELVFVAGGGLHSFSLDKLADGSDIGPPDVRYTFGAFGLQARVMPFTWWRLWAGINYLYVPTANAGEIERADRYGNSSTTAFRVDGATEFFVFKGLKVIVRGYYEKYALDFQAMAGTTHRANSATDKYAGGAISVGYEY